MTVSDAKRRLLFTVGTSLFESASWRVEGPFAKICGYRDWAEEKEFRDNPSKRRSMISKNRWLGTGEFVARDLRALLDEAFRDGSKEDLLEFFAADDIYHPRRFSAEVSTLLMLRDETGTVEQKGLAGFIDDNYSQIQLIAPDDESDPSHVAAHHLRGQIARMTQFEDVRVSCQIMGKTLERKFRTLDDYLFKLRVENDPRPIDFIVSGGYKVYAVAAGAALYERPLWRTYYTHEEKQQLLHHSWDPKKRTIRTETKDHGYGPPDTLG